MPSLANLFVATPGRHNGVVSNSFCHSFESHVHKKDGWGGGKQPTYLLHELQILGQGLVDLEHAQPLPDGFLLLLQGVQHGPELRYGGQGLLGALGRSEGAFGCKLFHRLGRILLQLLRSIHQAGLELLLSRKRERREGKGVRCASPRQKKTGGAKSIN